MAYAVAVDPAYISEGTGGLLLDVSIVEWVKANAPHAKTVRTFDGIKLYFAERMLADSFTLGFL